MKPKKTPLHRKITDDLRRRIVGGHYGPDDLPPEVVLMEEFGCSRHTIRSALLQLVSEGLIERRAGSGTRVTERARGGVWVIGALGDLIGEFASGHYLTLMAREESAQRHPAAMRVFGIRPSASIFYILRVLLKGEQPYALADVFAWPELAAQVPEAELGAKPLIQLLENYARIRPSWVRQTATAEAASDEVSRKLGLSKGDPVLRLKRTYFDATDRPVLHTEVVCRSDRYEQVIDFEHEGP